MLRSEQKKKKKKKKNCTIESMSSMVVTICHCYNTCISYLTYMTTFEITHT
jgi:hypothetical protein